MNHTKRSREFELQLKELSKKLGANTLTHEDRVIIAGILELKTTDNTCLINSAPDEPIFVLRAKDPLAADAVMHWYSRAASLGFHADKRDDAYLAAQEMMEWKRVMSDYKKREVEKAVEVPKPEVEAATPRTRPPTWGDATK